MGWPVKQVSWKDESSRRLNSDVLLTVAPVGPNLDG